MKTEIFTLMPHRKRGILSFFIPLLALFVGLGGGHMARAQRFNSDNLTIVASPTGATPTTTTYTGKGLNTPKFNTTDLGNGQFFNQSPGPNQGSLILNAASASINSGGLPITNTSIQYRVYPTATPPIDGKFNTLNLSLTSANDSTSNPVTFAASNAGIDLLNQPAVLGGGNYTVEVFFQSYYYDRNSPGNGPGGTSQFLDPGTVGYKATFNVVTPPVTPAGGSTTWKGGNTSDPNPGLPGGPNDWNTPKNWTNGVPTALSDAIIPVPAATQPPILNVSTQDYSVRNLTIQGNGVTFRGLVRVTTATLKIYGNVVNGGGGILATTDAPGNGTSSNSSLIILAGGDQTIDQGRFANLRIENNAVTADASGNPVITPSTVPVIKSLFGKLDIPSSLTFAPNINANLRTTSFDAKGNPAIDQNGGAVVDLSFFGSVFGETTTASVLGLFKASRTITIGQKNTFGGIGIDITILGTSDGSATQQGFITRSTGLPFNPITTGTGPRPQSVKRVFANSFTGVQSGFNADVVFHYLNSTSTLDGRYNELNGNVEGRLELFRTTSGSTFVRLGGTNTVDPGGPDSYPGNAGTVEKTGLNSINTLTLADFTTNPLPLPVELVAFDVQRTGTNALVTWTTATEKNSKGFFVEVSADGKTFRSLGFVASPNGFSSKPQSYTFTDSESGKFGKRYYRLHQVDFDGKISFSPVRLVDFTGAVSAINAASAASFAVYPNPLTTGDALHLNLVNDASTSAQVTVLDLTGRVLSQQDVTLGEGSAVNMDNLKAGVYFVRIATPSGLVKTVKVQKQ